jgi:hypothetical protein
MQTFIPGAEWRPRGWSGEIQPHEDNRFEEKICDESVFQEIKRLLAPRKSEPRAMTAKLITDS